MAWTVWADDWETGELANTNKFQTVRVNTDITLRAVRTWVVIINDPVFTDLSMDIYSNEERSGDNTPVQLLHSSTSPSTGLADVRTKSEIHTLEHGVKEIYFEFNDVPLQGDTWYNFVMQGTGYVPTASSYLAWMKAFPDPVYSNNFTPALETLPFAPYQMYLIGSIE